MKQPAKNPFMMLAPSYYKKFSCIGGECPDACCYGWRVDIDKKTFEKYSAVDEPLNGFLFSEVLQKTEPGSDANFGSLKMKKDGFCPFFTKERLCAVHAKYGETYLSPTCAGFPRRIKQVFGQLEASCSLACPPAATLILSEKNPMTFKIVPLETGGAMPVLFASKATREGPGRYFEEIQRLCIEVVQNRALPVEERLLILGLFVKGIQRSLDTDAPEEIPLVIDKYRRLQNVSTVREMIGRIKVDDQLMIALSVELVGISREKGFNHPQLHALIARSVTALQLIPGESLKAVADRYATIRADVLVPAVRTHANVFENYLTHRIFHESFPLSRTPLFDAYVDLAVSFAIMKLLLIGSCSENTPDEATLIHVVQVVSKAVEHSSRCLKGIETYLASSGYNTMAHMATLIMG